MSIFSGFSASDEYGRPGGGGGGRGGGRGGGSSRGVSGVGGRAAHHRRQLLAGSSSSSSSSSGYPMTYAEGGGGASGGGLDIEAIADQVVQEMASNPAQFNGIDYGAIIPADAVAQERNRQGAVAEREAAIRRRVKNRSVALRASDADLAAIEEDLFPAEDEGLVTERIFEEGSRYGGQPRVEMDRIVSLSPSSRGAYPGVSRADLYEAFGGDDDREPEVDAYGFACPVPTRRDGFGSLDADASVLVPSRVPTEFMGRMGLSSTAPRPENLGRYGQDSFGNDRYGEDAPSPFMDSLKVGFGVGLGVAGAFVGLGLVVRALR